MKKIISMILSAVMTLSVLIAAMPAVFASTTREDGIISLLNALEIMQGDENGDMQLDRKVSRAEFAKIAVAASEAKNSVAFGLNISPYKDVPYTEWYAPYVQAAVSEGYVKGYLDATFRPDNTVTYEEAVTMILRVLGYDDSSFGIAYPYGQISKAQDIDILDDVNAQIGDEMTRRQVMYLVYNALQANLAGSSSAAGTGAAASGMTTTSTTKSTSAGTLLAAHDCVMYEDANVISTSAQSSSLGSDKVFTSAGEYTKGDYFDEDSVGMEGDMFVKNSKEVIAFVPDDKYSNGYEKYVVYSTLPNAVVGYSHGSFETIDIPDHTTVYKNQTATTYLGVKSSLEMGDLLYVKRTEGGSIDYVSFEEGNLEGPVCVAGSNWIDSFTTNSSTAIMRGGNKVSASDIQTNDIIYYSADLNMILAYTDKVTGVYEKATPTKDSPTSVTVSGKEYTIESVEAFNDLSSSGSFKYGDTVTLLLGRTGEVAGVAGGKATSGTTVSASTSGSGFLIETGKKDFTNADNTVYSSYYAKVVTTDGNVNEYATSSNYSSLVCSAVRVGFKNGKASIAAIRSDGSVLGKVNASKGTIGDTDMAEDIKILDTSGTYNDDIPGYCRIYPQRIDGVTLNSSSVLYYSKNGAGEIDELILKDVTGDTYSYGVVTKRDSKTGAYTIDIDGTQNTYVTGFTSNATGPHRFKISGATVKSMQQLIACPSTVSELSRTEALIGSQKYLLSDKVVVYHRTDSSTYMKMPIDDAINGNYRLTAYYDKAQTSGGRIRIIIAQDK
ncbi:MAG: S-layer homology domain-containing protein [Hominilimicola sp.]